MSECQCSGRGYCEHFGRPMTQREYELCSGTCPPERPCTAETTAKYQEAWAKGPRVEQPTAATLALRAAEAHAKWLADGGRLASDEQQAQRRAACDACEWRDREADRCKHPGCGCYLKGVLLNKIRMATETCPIARWTDSPTIQQPFPPEGNHASPD